MTLTNRQMIVAWAVLLALTLAWLMLTKEGEKHALNGFHQELRTLSATAHYVLAPLSSQQGAASQAGNGLIPLTIQASPADARVRIMNISPVYVPGMQLEPGSYDIEVSAPGYRPERRWVKLTQANTSFMFNLSHR